MVQQVAKTDKGVLVDFDKNINIEESAVFLNGAKSLNWFSFSQHLCIQTCDCKNQRIMKILSWEFWVIEPVPEHMKLTVTDG